MGNKAAAECALELGDSIGGVTDATGFGFLGHLREMLTPDAGATATVGARIWATKVPLLPQAMELSSMGEAVIPGGTVQNLKHVEAAVDFAADVSTAHRMLLADAQTSGGLLIGVRKAAADKLLELLAKRPECSQSAIVGEVIALQGGKTVIAVVP